MDLTAAFSGLQQSKVLGEVQIAVARKLLDQQRLDGSAAVQLIEAASKGVNQSGDQLAAAATGLGGDGHLRLITICLNPLLAPLPTAHALHSLHESPTPPASAPDPRRVRRPRSDAVRTGSALLVRRRDRVNEANPQFNQLLQYHPLAFARRRARVDPGLLDADPRAARRLSLWLLLGVVMGHTWGMTTWIRSLWPEPSYWVCLGLWVVVSGATAVVVGSRQWAVGRAGERIEDRG